MLMLFLSGGLLWLQRKPPRPPKGPVAGSTVAKMLHLSPEPPPDTEEAFIEFEIDNSYSPQNLEELKALIDALPPRKIDLRQDQTLSALIKEQYGLGRSNLPELYKALEDNIARANGLTSREVIRPRPLDVPAVPPWGFAKNAPPAFAEMNIRSATWDTNVFVSEGLPGFSAADLMKPARTVYHTWIPKPLLRSSGFAPVRKRAVVITSPLSIRLAADVLAAPPAVPVLSSQQAAVLRQRLATSSRDVTLFVLDSGWPTESDWRESRRYIGALLATVRQKYGLPASPSLAATGAFTLPAYSDINKAHVRHIKSVLEEFQALSSRVHVVYVPLTRDQGAKDVIEEIIAVGVALRYVKKGLGQSEPPAGQTLAEAAEKEGRENATKALKNVGVKPETDGTVSIDAGLVGGLFAIATEIAQDSKAVFFVNESWTTLDDVAQMPFPGVSRGFVVAAVGNTPKLNVAEAPIVSFAGLASAQLQILAVMTLDRTGTEDCDTSIVPYTHINLGAVGFSGRLSDGRCGGSSFAAPRVAWILAARETMASTPIVDGQQWVGELRERLKTLRPSGSMPARLLFDPVRYLSAP